jgi:hypothetical protein
LPRFTGRIGAARTRRAGRCGHPPKATRARRFRRPPGARGSAKTGQEPANREHPRGRTGHAGSSSSTIGAGAASRGGSARSPCAASLTHHSGAPAGSACSPARTDRRVAAFVPAACHRQSGECPQSELAGLVPPRGGFPCPAVSAAGGPSSQKNVHPSDARIPGAMVRRARKSLGEARHSGELSGPTALARQSWWGERSPSP